MVIFNIQIFNWKIFNIYMLKIQIFHIQLRTGKTHQQHERYWQTFSPDYRTSILSHFVHLLLGQADMEKHKISANSSFYKPRNVHKTSYSSKPIFRCKASDWSIFVYLAARRLYMSKCCLFCSVCSVTISLNLSNQTTQEAGFGVKMTV